LRLQIDQNLILGQKDGPFMKDVLTKSRKFDFLSFCPQNVHIASTPSRPCRHTIILQKYDVLEQKFGHPHMKNPLPPCPHYFKFAFTK